MHSNVHILKCIATLCSEGLMDILRFEAVFRNPRIAVEQVEGGGGIWPDYGKREDEGLG